MEIDKGIYHTIEADPDYAAAYFEELATRPREARVKLFQKLLQEDTRTLAQALHAWKKQETKHLGRTTQLVLIALEMKEKDLSINFIASAVDASIESEGVADLMNRWINEADSDKRSAIISDLRGMIKDQGVPKPASST